MRMALAIADVAALSVLRSEGDPADRFVDDDTDRSSYHLQVHQATGMMKVQLGVSMKQAFVRLQAYAFAQGRPLSDVAADVVAGRLRFDREDGG
jgi:AmiR/NasT family two-component response regulator